MQVIEYFIWTSKNCDKQNSITSKLIFPVLALQPLALVVSTYFYKISYVPNNVLKSYIMIYLLGTIGVLLKYFYANCQKIKNIQHISVIAENIIFLSYIFDNKWEQVLGATDDNLVASLTTAE